MTSSARKFASYKFVQGAAESSCGGFVHVTKLVRRFSEAPPLVEKLDRKGCSENSSASRDAMGATRLENIVLSSPDEHHVLLYVESRAAHKLNQKQNSTFSGRWFYF